MPLNQTTTNPPKNFRVTFVEQAFCIPSKFQTRITGWQPIYGGEWTCIAKARQSLSLRPRRTARWDGLRLIKRVSQGDHINETVVT